MTKVTEKLCIVVISFGKKRFAPGEARTHGLQIMRLTRCLLRYRGECINKANFFKTFNSGYLAFCNELSQNPALSEEQCCPGKVARDRNIFCTVKRVHYLRKKFPLKK